MPEMFQWLQAGAIALAIGLAFLPAEPATIERTFSIGVYPTLQRYLTAFSNTVPFAFFDVLTAAAAVALVKTVAGGIRRARRERRWAALGPPVIRIAASAALIYVVFLVLWGFNYRRLPMAERLVMESLAAPASEAVVALGLESVSRLNVLHADAHAQGWTVDPWRDAPLRAAFATVQPRLSDAPPAVPGRLKRSLYGPFFRWTSVDGMVNPFALEVLANPDLLPFERPFVAAHEWAHLAGYAHEAEANFVGWLTCLRGNVGARYSGWLYLYWQISGEVGPANRARLASTLGPGPRRDVQAIVDRIRRGQLPSLRNASWRVYDHYLRANRVEEGIRSYGEVVTLILRARFEDEWVPVRRVSASR
jgi:hypothetical protein